jgi:hypothetical protein
VGKGGKSRHKKEGETDDKQTIQILRAENRSLHKQVKRLEKLLRNYEHSEIEEPYQPPIINKPNVNKNVIKCAKCNSDNTSQVPAGVFVFTKCNDCGSKRRNRDATLSK